MSEPETYRFDDDGTRFPNSRLPVCVYRRALSPDATAMRQTFAQNDWANAWQDGIFTYHHFHSIAHEVLGIARGEVKVRLGGPSGETVSLAAGDVVVIPAGVAHQNVGGSPDLLVIGAYPGGADYDMRRGDPAEYVAAKEAARSALLPATDPVTGKDGALLKLWSRVHGRQL